MTTTGPLTEVRRWLHRKRPELDTIPDDLDLIEHRVIDSLQFVEFIYLLQSLSGREIVVDTLTVDHFRTLRDIERNFLSESRLTSRY